MEIEIYERLYAHSIDDENFEARNDCNVEK